MVAMPSWQGYGDLIGLPADEPGLFVSKQLMGKQHSGQLTGSMSCPVWYLHLAPLAPRVLMEPTGEDRGSDGESAAASAGQCLSSNPSRILLTPVGNCTPPVSCPWSVINGMPCLS